MDTLEIIKFLHMEDKTWFILQSIPWSPMEEASSSAAMVLS